MTTAEQDDEDRLVAYVSRALEMRERGEEPQLEELCREHPELIDRVAEVLGGAPRLAKLAVSAHEFDGLAGRLLEGRYRLDARLGAGSMGIVYRAFDTKLSRSVAVKVLRPELFGGRDAEQRFLREAEVLATLRHPNVVAVHDRGRTSDGVSYLVMELLSGQPLIALLTEHERVAETGGPAGFDDMSFVVASVNPEGQFEQTWMRQAVRWTADLARGLGEAHRLGILHRDVKPSNVFVGKDGRARLLDFGVASSSQHATLTAGNAALGTPGYMAPEVITEQAPASAATDVYGLGATLYHLLARRAPYLGTMTNIIASVQRRDPIPVGRLRPGLQRDLHAIVDKAMARNARERYATMGEFESDLRAFLNHQPVTARPLSGTTRLWRRAWRSPSAKALAGVMLLLGVGVLTRQWFQWTTLRRADTYWGAMAALPPGLTLERPDLRRITDTVELAELRRLLDTAVESAAEVLPARLIRAGFLLDQGQAIAAADDMKVIATRLPSSVSAALAAAYASAAARDGVGHAALQLSGLPEPADVHDKYLIGYHLLRARSKEADEAIVQSLTDADAGWLPAREMLASALSAKAGRLRNRDPEVAADCWSKALTIMVHVESVRGRRTASSAHLMAIVHLGQSRFAEAAQCLRDGVRLSDWSNGLLRNLSQAQRQSGDFDGAIATCKRGIELRPTFAEHYQNLAVVYAELGDLAQSRAAIHLAPIPDGVEGTRLRSELVGLNEYCIAIRLMAKGRWADAAAVADVAARELLAAGGADWAEYTMSVAIRDGDREALAMAWLRIWSENPRDWIATTNLADLSGVLSGREAGQLLAEGLRRLARSQAPSKAPLAPAPINFAK